ncbi:hypothetical protein Q4508_12595 [Amphritea sp. 2_MG-2023]|uniref:hypothetical protein n=1 Tax=Amphritea TaxID=515417 RepID=UPI001C076374|nr:MULTISPECIES: hypothetical protein [Amphritea]MBU2967057.1 hypothetical protein [Amphritea atlantica]MDO6419390.1 hypothetical protein [Amphritea sp. 2_MG-2023]
MITLNGIALPDDLIWANEFAWSAVRQSAEVALTGALIVEEAAQQAGRPITLTGGWATRTLVEQLYALVQLPGQSYSLQINDQTYNVMFLHTDNAMTAEPVLAVTDPAPTDSYYLTLRFMVV